MKKFSPHWLVILMIGLLIGLQSCRKQYNATQEDMADYGWLLYEKATVRNDYQASNDWFLSSQNEDTTYMDAYNGLGWTFGRLTELSSSLYYFHKGLQFQPGLYDTTNIKYEIWAGLCFANNAAGYDSACILYGDSLIDDLTSGLTTSPWYFSHNNINQTNTLNHLDVRVTLAASNFAMGEFDASVDHMNVILSELANANSNFNPDINTVAGRTTLAVYIDSMQTILSSQ